MTPATKHIKAAIAALGVPRRSVVAAVVGSLLDQPAVEGFTVLTVEARRP